MGNDDRMPCDFPEGVGVVKWMVPGGKDIAVATSKKMENYRAVIWAHHGLFCSGIDFDSTFGLMHTIEKAQRFISKYIAYKQKSTKHYTRLISSIGKEFHVTLDERFLYEK